MYYREDKQGQILEEGINEAGAMSSWIAAATSYSTNNRIMVPFYIFYSMFGFQRIGDLAWAAGDMQARGFLLGATAGRTTLNGEGLQHQDGHSHLMSATIPNCISYDPTFAHEVAVIMQHGLKRMVQNQENVWYYITVMNENYPHPGLKKGQEEGILRGMYLLREGPGRQRHGQVDPARAVAGQRHDPARGDRRGRDAGEGLGRGRRRVERHQLHRTAARRHRRRALEPAASDGQAAQALRHPAARTHAPGRSSRRPTTCGSSPTRSGPTFRADATTACSAPTASDAPTRATKLREFFEVDRRYVVIAALRALADEGVVPIAKVAEAIKKYGIDPDKRNPVTV